MPTEIVDSIVSMEAEKINLLINKPSSLALYCPRQELERNLAELKELEKKIIWITNSIIKVNEPVLISKLEKKKEELEKKRKNLNILIKKLECVTGSISDFILFFIFSRRFQKLAIGKLNFEDDVKTLSHKLIYKLQNEEEKLYNSYVGGDCFSKALKILSFEPYQCYFQEFAKNFFDNIQTFSDPYINSLLILKAVIYECSYFCMHKPVGDFNLTDIKFFLSRNIPHHVVLPNANYKLVALRCFFYYEIAKEYLKLRSVKNYLGSLKKSVSLELNIFNYNSYNKEIFLVGLYGLQEALNKIKKKYIDFLRIKSEDNELDANKSLVFIKLLVSEIQIINIKTKNLIHDKYNNLIKMRRLLAIISNESHLPKFLAVFYIKLGNDFILNEIGKTETVQTNKEALNHLFHAICRDKFYTPLNIITNLFIDKVTADYSLDAISVLETIELEDLIEFSFYYIFTLIYTDFNSYLNEFNTKLLYTELITFHRYINIKFDSLKKLEEKKNEKIGRFLEKIFKNKEEYYKDRKSILDEIKLHLEVVQDIKRILSDTKILEADLIPRVKSSSVPMPEGNLLITLLQKLEKKQKIYESEYQKIEKHQFINKSKSEKITKINNTHSKILKQIEDNKFIEFTESLTCLSENLKETLKHIGEDTLLIDGHRERISFSMRKLSSTISNLDINGTHNLISLSLPELLKLVDEIVRNSILIRGKSHKKKLFRLQELLNNTYSLIEFLVGQINIVINKYYNCNKEIKKTLSILSTYFNEDYNSSRFFSKSMAEKMKHNMKLLNEYIKLKKQSNWLNELIESIKLDTDPRVIKLYAIISEAEDYQKTYEILNEKINFVKKKSRKNFYKSKKIHSTVKQKNSDDADRRMTLSPTLPFVDGEITIENLNEIEAESNPISIAKKQLDLNDDLINDQGSLIVEKELTEENALIEVSLKNLSNSDPIDMTLLQDYEIWNQEFEKWKNDKHTQLYKLFHIIENCSKTVLINTGNAFLKYLSLHQNDLIERNEECKKRKDQIISFFNDPAKNKLFSDYLTQYLKWFNEIFQRIKVCMTLILQNEQNPEIQESPHLPSPLADNRAEFNSLLTFYLGATDKYNKFRDNLINEENKLKNLNRNFIKKILTLGSLDGMDEDNILSDFNNQLVRVNQLKLIIEREFETKQKIKEKLSLLASPEIVKFYLSRIDPYDADSLNNAENHLLHLQPVEAARCMVPSLQECNICTVPPTFYYLTPPTFYSDVAQSSSQIFYSM